MLLPLDSLVIAPVGQFLSAAVVHLVDALDNSLVACGDFDPGDQMDRYLRWVNEGYLSSTRECFDVL